MSTSGVERQVTGVRRRTRGGILAIADLIAAWTSTPRRLLQPVTDVTSRAAVAVAAMALLAGLLGWQFGWRELIVGFWLGLVLLAICALFILGRHQLSARFDLGRDRVVVGERANGALLVRNDSRRRSLPTTVELPVGRSSAVFHTPSMRVGAEREELFMIPTHRRAVIGVGPVLSVRSDPFGLFRREQSLTGEHELYVHPRTVRIESSATGLIRDLEGRTVRKLSDSDVAFHALRQYVPGDDRRHIHWKSTARTGTLMVRQFEETRRSHLLVVLSNRLDDYASDAEFETAVSAAGSLGVQCLTEGQTLSATTSSRHLVTPTPQQLLDRLSGVEYEPAAPRQSEGVRRIVREVSGASVAVLVCGSLVDPREMRRSRRFLPLDVRTIVVQVREGATTAVHAMTDLDVAVLGDLDDLPSTMRRLTA